MKAHIRKNCPTALCWQPGGHLPALEKLCAEAGLRLIVTSEADLCRCVGELCGLPGRFSPVTVPHSSSFEEALVLSGLSDPELDRLLTALRQAEISIPLKAVVTPTNQKWPLYALLEELSEEHAVFQEQAKQ